MNNDRRVTELVESLPGVFSPKPELCEEFVHHFCALVLVNPYSKGGAGGVVVSCFANRVKHPVDLEGSHPLVRGLSNLCASRRGRSYVGEVTSLFGM